MKTSILNDFLIIENLTKKNLSELARPIGLTGGQIKCLILIQNLCKQEKEMCQKDLEANLHDSKSSLSDLLNALESSDCLIRKVKKGDSRYKILEITDKGREIISLAEANKDEVEKKIIQGISNEELTLFKKIINKMSNNLGGNYEEE